MQETRGCIIRYRIPRKLLPYHVLPRLAINSWNHPTCRHMPSASVELFQMAKENPTEGDRGTSEHSDHI